jgi:hypothetical protein
LHMLHQHALLRRPQIVLLIKFTEPFPFLQADPVHQYVDVELLCVSEPFVTYSAISPVRELRYLPDALKQ